MIINYTNKLLLFELIILEYITDKYNSLNKAFLKPLLFCDKLYFLLSCVLFYNLSTEDVLLLSFILITLKQSIDDMFIYLIKLLG